jgi:hypothetical protein
MQIIKQIKEKTQQKSTRQLNEDTNRVSKQVTSLFDTHLEMIAPIFEYALPFMQNLVSDFASPSSYIELSDVQLFD